MRARAIVAGALLIIVSLVVPAYALDEGVPDRDRHPQVGMLAWDGDGPGPDPGTFFCTGSVLSDRHFLTAAHCIVPLPPDMEWMVSLEAGSPGDPVYRPGVLWDDTLPPTGPLTRGGVATVHPDFDADTLAHDVAVVTFAAGSFAGVTPIRLPRLGLADRLPKKQPVRLVGYGIDPERGDGAPVLVAEGYRQTRMTSITKVTKRQVELRAGLCLGDSGSPQLLPRGGVAISLLSQVGNEDCAGPFLAQRLDTRAEQRFLSRYVQLPRLPR